MSSFIVEVMDVDENLHNPTFGNLFLRTAVPENLPPRSHVTTVTARDLDSRPRKQNRNRSSRNGQIEYSIREGDGLGNFFIDEHGNIKTTVSFDREEKTFYWITVFATDRGAIPRSTKVFRLWFSRTCFVSLNSSLALSIPGNLARVEKKLLTTVLCLAALRLRRNTRR